jgi:hypothetical protein
MAREENRMANTLVKQASGYEVSMGIFFIKDRPMMQSTVACIDESVEGKLDHGEGNVSNESTTPRAANGESVANAGTIKGAFSADKGKTDQRKSVMSRAEGTSTRLKVRQRTVTEGNVAGSGDDGENMDWKKAILEHLQEPRVTKDR